MLPWDTGQLKRGDSLSKCGLSRMSKTILGSPYQTHSIIDPQTLFQVLRPLHSRILDCLGWGLTDRQGWQSCLAVTFVVGHGCCLAGEGWFVFGFWVSGAGFLCFPSLPPAALEVAEKTLENFDEFWLCGGCGKIYWEGRSQHLYMASV